MGQSSSQPTATPIVSGPSHTASSRFEPQAGSKEAAVVNPASGAGQTANGPPTATGANAQPQAIVAANLPEPLPARGTQTLDRLTALVLGGLLFFLARAIWRKVGWVART